MSFAWETVEDDVERVLLNNGVELSEPEFTRAFNSLDKNAIEKAALRMDDLNEQSEEADYEIECQLKKLGFISK